MPEVASTVRLLLLKPALKLVPLSLGYPFFSMRQDLQFPDIICITPYHYFFQRPAAADTDILFVQATVSNTGRNNRHDGSAC
jgi:hypothetical protein